MCIQELHIYLPSDIYCVVGRAAFNTSTYTVIFEVVISYLHSVHCLPKLVELMSRAKGF